MNVAVCPVTRKPCDKSYMAGGCHPGCCVRHWTQWTRENVGKPVSEYKAVQLFPTESGNNRG
jgi:hypothetical protein